MTKYLIAEKFRSVQGEGVYAGTPMAFIRFVGCSVGKTCCVACDTDFEQPIPWRGGGEFTAHELRDWAGDYQHICLTGGEPLDQDLTDISEVLTTQGRVLHIETSGTKPLPECLCPAVGDERFLWVCVSPKPGFMESMILIADEVKVIMPGLGILKNGVCQPAIRKTWTPLSVSPKRVLINDQEQSLGVLADIKEEAFNWPTLEDALRWAHAGKIVFIQPRNHRMEVDKGNLKLCQDIVAEHPELRLSLQLHKVLGVQ